MRVDQLTIIDITVFIDLCCAKLTFLIIFCHFLESFDHSLSQNIRRLGLPGLYFGLNHDYRDCFDDEL